MKSKIQITGVLMGGIFTCSNIASANDMSTGKVKSAACSGCHGLKGNSQFPFRPNLAGQNAEYIVSQLKAFKSGSRINNTMKKISESLSSDEMMALATYYSRQPPKTVNGNPLLIKKGQEKYSLCWSCHGENGEGPGSYPRVASQHSQYTVQQLNNFKNGSRLNPVMKAIVADLSSDDMEALGAYLGALGPQYAANKK